MSWIGNFFPNSSTARGYKQYLQQGAQGANTRAHRRQSFDNLKNANANYRQEMDNRQQRASDMENWRHDPETLWRKLNPQLVQHGFVPHRSGGANHVSFNKPY